MNSMAGDEAGRRHLLCRVDELEATGCREFRLGSGDWPLKGFVVRVEEGVRAYVNACPHRVLPLNLLPDRFLSADGSLILCCMHGAVFDKGTGLCLSGPCAGRALAAIAVKVQAGEVLLEANPNELIERWAR
jgi:nitrite reductase/ring-hydroxylating ferredoxin subunit